MRWLEWIFALWFVIASNDLRAQTNTVGKAVVLDGDTIRIGITHYRLQGINAPELFEPYGQAARFELLDIIGTDIVSCQWDGTMNHKRYVAVCSTGHYPDIGAELIRRGLALDCTRYSGGKYRKLEPPDSRRILQGRRYCD
jgi:micrococcal nuclease